MKRAEREIYIVLTDAIDRPLCCNCEFRSGSCEAAECKHPLVDRIEYHRWGEGLEPGQDCWGFRPDKDTTLEEKVDIAGEILSHDWAVCTYERRKDGKIKIAGSMDW